MKGSGSSGRIRETAKLMLRHWTLDGHLLEQCHHHATLFSGGGRALREIELAYFVLVSGCIDDDVLLLRKGSVAGRCFCHCVVE
jgi:hypothetical protein